MSWCSGCDPQAVLRCLRSKPLIDFSPPAQRRRFEFVEGAAARPPRWGSQKEEQTAQPPQKEIAPCEEAGNREQGTGNGPEGEEALRCLSAFTCSLFPVPCSLPLLGGRGAN